MIKQSLTVVSMFVASLIVGYNMIPTQKVQAKQPVIISPIEFPQLAEKKSVENIDVEYNLETQEVSVKGTTDANVNFKTVGKQKPIVKWRTKVKEVKVIEKSGYPHVASMSKVTEKPINILDSYEQDIN